MERDGGPGQVRPWCICIQEWGSRLHRGRHYLGITDTIRNSVISERYGWVMSRRVDVSHIIYRYIDIERTVLSVKWILDIDNTCL
jgi:hypothetical protein